MSMGAENKSTLLPAQSFACLLSCLAKQQKLIQTPSPNASTVCLAKFHHCFQALAASL